MSNLLRLVRAVTAAAIAVALVAQFADAADVPDFDVVDHFSDVTILSNLGAMLVLVALVARPLLVARQGFSVARGAVTVYMTISAIVHHLLVVPDLVEGSTAAGWISTVLHVVAPVVVVADWFVAGPPTAITRRQMWSWLVAPAAWLAYVMFRGRATDWYPYPFLDPRVNTRTSIVLTCLAILAGTVAVAAAVRWASGTDDELTVEVANGPDG